MKKDYKSYSLSGFPGIPFEYIRVLESVGIKNTRKLLADTDSEVRKKMLSKKTGIPVNRLDELESLSDLVRINGIGYITARILYETGVTSVLDLASSNYQLVYVNCRNVMKKRGHPMHFITEPIIIKWIRIAKLQY